MATNQHNLSRRQALAGIGIVAIAAPIAGATIAAQPSRSAWNAALADYDKAEADYDRQHDRWNRARETYIELVGRDTHVDYDEGAGRLSGFHQLDHGIDEWGDKAANAASTLIKMPAPDQDALLWKVEYLWADDLTASYCDEWMEVVLADFRRLLTNGRA